MLGFRGTQVGWLVVARSEKLYIYHLAFRPGKPRASYNERAFVDHAD